MDWLTHGGLSWETVDELAEGLDRAGLVVRRRVDVGDPAATLLLAERPPETTDDDRGAR